MIQQSTEVEEDVSTEMADNIREFAETIDNPNQWMITVPARSFDAVKEQLDTNSDGLGTQYHGISLCYSEKHTEIHIEYRNTLSDHQSTTSGGSQ